MTIHMDGRADANAANAANAGDAGLRRTRRSDEGFTLVEILVAIVLVGILSAVVVVGISNLTSKGQTAACATSLDAARSGSAVYLAKTGVYPTTLAQMTTATSPALVLPSGVSLNAMMSVSHPAGTIAAGSGWWLAMLAGANSTAPTFSCSNAVPGPACPGTRAGWSGEYYANATLAGSPTVCRDDDTVSFSWGTAAPMTGLPSDQFSVRWSRIVTEPPGTYSFDVGSDDGVRVFVDGVTIIDWWTDHVYTTRTFTATVTDGPHEVIIEYYDATGPAQIATPRV